jgi:hypothetical protein
MTSQVFHGCTIPHPPRFAAFASFSRACRCARYVRESRPSGQRCSRAVDSRKSRAHKQLVQVASVCRDDDCVVSPNRAAAECTLRQGFGLESQRLARRLQTGIPRPLKPRGLTTNKANQLSQHQRYAKIARDVFSVRSNKPPARASSGGQTRTTCSPIMLRALFTFLSHRHCSQFNQMPKISRRGSLLGEARSATRFAI